MLLILGNGFDINLGLPTKYSDFIKSIKEDNPFFNTQLYKYLIKVFINESLVTDDDNINNETRWLDLENELKKYIISEKERYVPYINDTIQLANKYRIEFQFLSDAITQYLKIVINNISIKECHASNLIKLLYSQYEQILKTKPTDFFEILTFNYTSKNTIKYLLKSNSSFTLFENANRKSIIIHEIHGNLESNNIIVGIESNAQIPKEFNFLKKGLQFQYPSMVNVENILKQHQEIHIYGFSFGETDAPYFRNLFGGYSSNPIHKIDATNQQKTIIFYYFGQIAYDQIIERLDELTEKNVDRLRQQNDIKFINIENYLPDNKNFSEDFFYLK